MVVVVVEVFRDAHGGGHGGGCRDGLVRKFCSRNPNRR